MNNEQILNDDISAKTKNKEKIAKSRSSKIKDEFTEKNCEVINYNKSTKTLDIKFSGYGIRIKGVEYFNNNNGFVIVKYKGEIGKSNFVIKV